MTEITLGAEQARFAAELVARGRYRDVAEVVAAALAELERAEMAATAPASEPPEGCDPLRGKVWLAPDMEATPDELIDLMGGGR